jgi:hypothetical protein
MERAMESITMIALRLAAASASSTPRWGDYVLLVLMTVFLLGVLVIAWKHREH